MRELCQQTIPQRFGDADHFFRRFGAGIKFKPADPAAGGQVMDLIGRLQPPDGGSGCQLDRPGVMQRRRDPFPGGKHRQGEVHAVQTGRRAHIAHREGFAVHVIMLLHLFKGDLTRTRHIEPDVLTAAAQPFAGHHRLDAVGSLRGQPGGRGADDVHADFS